MRSGRPEVVDSDVDLHDCAQPAETRPRHWDIVVAIAVGGVVGAESRWGLGEIVPHTPRQFPWSSLIINATGCLLIGALMVLLLELTSPHRLTRPFLGVGLLGGYTTFSTFAVDAERLVEEHRPLVALGYVGTTVMLCLIAVLAGTMATQFAGTLIVNARIRHRDRGGPR